ncbi:MAG: endonuclease/exonuclease/phosphatase family protein [Gammaproteobacteria bacterium]
MINSDFHLKVLTYNIHKGFSPGNARFVLREIREALTIIHPDLVFLQEIQGEHFKHRTHITNWPTESQFEFLADQLWSHHAYAKNAIYEEGHHGNAILSKYPIVSWENIDVSPYPTASRSILHGVIEIPELHFKLHALCIHLGLFKIEREQQLITLCQRIESHVPHNEPLIIGGDFNDWRGHAEAHLEQDLELREVFKVLTGNHARSFPAWRPTLQVDRIYFRGVKPELCARLKQEPWKRLSDHLPLYAEFSV